MVQNIEYVTKLDSSNQSVLRTSLRVQVTS